MINYNKNDLIDECLARYYQTFACTLDTADYCPEKYNEKIRRYIFKNLKRQFKKINREDKLYQRGQEKKNKVKKTLRGWLRGKKKERQAETQSARTESDTGILCAEATERAEAKNPESK